MGYITNKTINCLNIHAALLSLVEQACLMFGPIYIYTIGFSLPEVFLLYGGLNVARIPFRFLSFPTVRLIGLKGALMLGTTGFCLSFPLLPMVKGYDIWLALYVIMFGIFSAMYWHCYHCFYSLAGEAEHRGKHLSVAVGLSTAVSAVAPWLGTMLISYSGFGAYFLLPLPILLVMLFFLSRCQNIPVAKKSWKEGRKLMFNLGAKIHLAESTVYYVMSISWVFMLYFYVEKFTTFGVILTFGIAVQVLYQLWLGKIIDHGKGRMVAHIAGVLRVLLVLCRALVPLNMPRVLALETLWAASNVHHAIAQPTVMYNTGKNSGDAFWYWLFAEMAFDIGSAIGAIAAALLLFYGTPLNIVVLLALPGVLTVWWLTYNFFDKKPKRKRN